MISGQSSKNVFFNFPILRNIIYIYIYIYKQKPISERATWRASDNSSFDETLTLKSFVQLK
jgi:hypothetical protein